MDSQLVVFDGKQNTKNLMLVRKWSIPGGDFVFIWRKTPALKIAMFWTHVNYDKLW